LLHKIVILIDVLLGVRLVEILHIAGKQPYVY